MSPKVLIRLAITLAVVLVVWGGFALFGSRHRDAAGTLQIPHLAGADVSRIAFRKGSDTVVMTRNGGAWLVNGFPASGRSVQTFLKATGDTTLRSEIVAKSPSSQARLGVDSTNGKRLTVESGGRAALDLWIGNRGPDFDGFYIRPVGSNVVYVLHGFFAELLSQGLDDWREKEIATLSPDSIGKIEAERGKARWSLERGGSGWMLGRTGADSTKVARYLERVTTLRAAGFPDGAQLDSISFAHPGRHLALYTRAGKPLLSLVFDSSRAGYFWVRADSGGPVYRLDADIANLAVPAESALVPTPKKK
ncbi:MAG TPA: DUF4340 domain-containing protein [Gemmatimonadales bacterium]|nr:DUF4340 domain-containing protein [Gemmatimonadales bacterium]